MVLNGMFERMHACMGFENALIALLDDPESCKEYLKAMADWKIEYFKKIVKYYKPDIINAHDDYGSNDRMFMSPETWRELFKPELARMVKACHDLGVYYQHHSCGYIEPIFDDLVEIGVDAIDPLQACNTNLAQLKKRYGDKIAFCGGFDNVGVLEYPGSSPEDIKKEYRRVVDMLAPGGGYVVWPITGTFDFAPHMLQEHFAYGMKFHGN
jgi:uroporphyrinogen-III decarboxylase